MHWPPAVTAVKPVGHQGGVETLIAGDDRDPILLPGRPDHQRPAFGLKGPGHCLGCMMDADLDELTRQDLGRNPLCLEPLDSIRLGHRPWFDFSTGSAWE